MKKTQRFFSDLLIICPVLLLAGCTGQFQQSMPQSGQNSKASAGGILITVAELTLVEHHAYDKGFADGQAYERKNPSSPTAIVPPCPVSISCSTQAAPIEHPSPRPQTTEMKTQSQTKPSLDYSTSGPARPLPP